MMLTMLLSYGDSTGVCRKWVLFFFMNINKMLPTVRSCLVRLVSSVVVFWVLGAGQENWILLAKDEDSMEKWMTTINAVIHGLFIKRYNVPEDNYLSQG